MTQKKDRYSIGEVSSLCNVSVKTLRYYDEIGLLPPACRKSDTNYRYYTHEQILSLFIIRKLRHLGISIKEIKEVLSGRDTKEMENLIRSRLLEIRNSIDHLKNQYTEGQILLERLESGESIASESETQWMTQKIQIEEIPLIPVMFTRRIKKNYRNSDVSVDRWFEIFRMVSKSGLHVAGSVILTYHNNPLEQFYQKDCDLEIGVQVNEMTDMPQVKQFGGFKAVTALHIGRNEGIIQSHIKAIQWLNEEGYTIKGPISEEYIISPVDINNEDDHITKIIIPISTKR